MSRRSCQRLVLVLAKSSVIDCARFSFCFLAPKKENSQGLLSLGKTVSSATTNTSSSSSGAASANRDQIMPLWDVDAALG